MRYCVSIYMCVYVCVSMYVRVCTQTHTHAHIHSASPVKFSDSFFFPYWMYLWLFFLKEISSADIWLWEAFHCLACMIVSQKTDPLRKMTERKRQTSHSICCFLFFVIFVFTKTCLSSFLCFVLLSFLFGFEWRGPWLTQFNTVFNKP